MKKFLSLATAVCLALGSSASAVTIDFDFGDVNFQTGGNYNNIYNSGTGDSVLDAIDSTGASTGISLAIVDFYAGSNTVGTTTPGGAAAAIFDVEATRDNRFGHSGEFSGDPDSSLGTVAIAGLDGSGATTYDFTFFASRMGVSDNREAKYELTGANSSTVFLDSANNTDNVVTASGIIPTAAGAITLLVSASDNNTNNNKFYYLGALEIVSTRVPEPTSLALFSLAGLGLALRRRS